MGTQTTLTVYVPESEFDRICQDLREFLEKKSLLIEFQQNMDVGAVSAGGRTWVGGITLKIKREVRTFFSWRKVLATRQIILLMELVRERLGYQDLSRQAATSCLNDFGIDGRKLRPEDVASGLSFLSSEELRSCLAAIEAGKFQADADQRLGLLRLIEDTTEWERAWAEETTESNHL